MRGVLLQQGCLIFSIQVSLWANQCKSVPSQKNKTHHPVTHGIGGGAYCLSGNCAMPHLLSYYHRKRGTSFIRCTPPLVLSNHDHGIQTAECLLSASMDAPRLRMILYLAMSQHAYTVKSICGI